MGCEVCGVGCAGCGVCVWGVWRGVYGIGFVETGRDLSYAAKTRIVRY